MKTLTSPPRIANPNLPGSGFRRPAIPSGVRRVMTGVTFSLALAVSAVVAGPSRADDSLVIRDFVLTRDIAEREPTEVVDSFDISDSRGYVFVRIANEGLPTGVTVVWHYEDSVHAAIDLDIGTSPGWRTWSSANLKAGLWSVELVDAEGIVLAQRSFNVGTAPAADQATDDRNGAGFEQLSEDPVTPPEPGAMPQPRPSTADNDG